MNEAQFKAAWQTLEADDLTDLAAKGGALANCLSHVFCAAYQCAVRQCFTDLEPRLWYCFAASEDRTGALPAVTLEDAQLNGSKTWIAAAGVVDKLIVTAGDSIVLVDRGAAGVTIDTGGRPSFLPEMTQGKAHFKNASIEATLHLSGDFGLAEAFYTTVASAAYLRRWQPEAAAAITDALRSLTPSASDMDKLIALQDQTKEMGKSVAAQDHDREVKADFDASGRLLGMYGRMLKNRR